MNFLIAALITTSLSAPTEPARAVTIEGREIEGVWRGLNDDGRIQLQTKDTETSLAPADLMLLQWRRENADEPTLSSRFEVHLVDGTRLRGDLKGGDAQQVIVATNLIPQLALSLTHVAAIRKLTVNSEEAKKAFDEGLETPHASEDTIVVQREGRIRVLKGVTESLSERGLVFDWRNRRMEVGWDTLYGVVLAQRGISASPRQVYCVLRDGSAWAGTLIAGDDRTIRLKSIDDLPIALPVANLDEIRFFSERVVFVDALKPVSYEFRPTTTSEWPYRVNRSVANRTLRIGDRRFERGIGMHSHAELKFELNESFSKLAGVIGIDEAVGDLGNVIFRIVADNKEIFNSGPVTGKDEPRDIVVPLDGARSLLLIVEYGEGLDIGDQADWADLRLIR